MCTVSSHCFSLVHIVTVRMCERGLVTVHQYTYIFFSANYVVDYHAWWGDPKKFPCYMPHFFCVRVYVFICPMYSHVCMLHANLSVLYFYASMCVRMCACKNHHAAAPVKVTPLLSSLGGGERNQLVTRGLVTTIRTN